ncbi:YcdB/YcdC domain-containing protein [Niallia oryzisoli]|uniref:YcdB/YcdC domain-containing protein n=1 Tax=Niallia oryzisoli TaxID=1737571 RepID=UPI0037353A46
MSNNYKKLGVISLSTFLSFGILSPSVGAAPLVNEQQEQIQIRIAEVDSEVTKSDLVQRVKTLFPGKFDFLKEKDFEMSSGHYFPENDTIRYDLSFFKEVKGKQFYGSFGFVGEDLQIEYFYYQPGDASDALFPTKVTKDQAQETATAFLKNFSKNGEYQLDTVNDYFPTAQTLVEPIRYTFSFVRTEEKIPVSDQTIQITVLGNGEVVEFFRNYIKDDKQTFDDVAKVLPKEEILTKIKANSAVDLRYKVDFNLQTGEPYVTLVYQQDGSVQGIHALTGQWQTTDGFSAELPGDNGIQLITQDKLTPRDPEFSLEKAKTFAEQLLAIDSEKVKLIIESVQEMENYFGQEVISIQYMYETEDGGGYGSELILDKQTGEVIQYYDVKRDLLSELGEKNESGTSISKAEAQDKAVQFLKEYVPSYLHDYSMPLDKSFMDEEGVYYFMFPRVVDGISVDGDQISVAISKDGSLVNLSADKLSIENWPSKEGIKSVDEASAKFNEGLSLDLRYINEENSTDNHYNLVYVPIYNNRIYSYIDAHTGEWNSTNTEDISKQVSHPWAEKELNYLIQTGILTVDDPAAFNGDAPITKGETMEIMMKSLTPIYSIYDEENESAAQSFDNIGPEHPLYAYIERAIAMGILDPGTETFDPDAVITREELAVWYIRALGMEKAAKNSSIYKLDFADADKVKEKNKGYVALAQSYGILKGSGSSFNPDQEVTNAQLAVSIFRLAKEVYEKNPNMY